jgi:hypothetical protein
MSNKRLKAPSMRTCGAGTSSISAVLCDNENGRGASPGRWESCRRISVPQPDRQSVFRLRVAVLQRRRQSSQQNIRRRSWRWRSYTLAAAHRTIATRWHGCCATPRLASCSMNTSRRTALVVFAHACRLGAESIVSKKVDSTYRSGPCPVWIKVRNPASIAVQRERSEIWNR